MGGSICLRGRNESGVYFTRMFLYNISKHRRIMTYNGIDAWCRDIAKQKNIAIFDDADIQQWRANHR